MAQANESFWIRPKNAEISRRVNAYSLARLNEIYKLNSNIKADAVRRILYDGGFSYEGVLPTGALNGDPQFTSFYDASAITAYSVLQEHLEKDVKGQGYDCTGRRQKSLYLQSLAGNKAAKKSLDIAFRGNFPSHPQKAWQAIEQIIHQEHDNCLRHHGGPDRLCKHLMYPTITPPLPNPAKLRSYILRARKARDIVTLSWMLDRDLESLDISAEGADRLVLAVLQRFGYTSMEIAAMRSIVSEQECKRNLDAVSNKDAPKEKGAFLVGCSFLAVPFMLGIGALYMVKSRSAIVTIIGIGLLIGLLGLLIVLCVVFRGKKGRPP